MKPYLKNLKVITVLLCVWSSQVLSATEETSSPNLHLVAITNGHYGTVEPNSLPSSLSGAYISGRLVLNRMNTVFNATSAQLLRSDNLNYVSRQDAFQILENLNKTVNETEDDDVVVLYMMMHGFGEGIGWNYFLQPGNVELERTSTGEVDISSYDVLGLSEQLLYIGDVVDQLKQMNTPYVLLIDACYEGDEITFPDNILNPTAKQNVDDTLSVVKFMNQFRDPYPVLFSAAPGDVVPTVKIPNASAFQATQKIGPIARRILLALDDSRSPQTLNVEDFIKQLQHSDLDQETRVPITFSTFEHSFQLSGTGGNVAIQEFVGSATDADVVKAQKELDVSSTDSSFPAPILLGSVELTIQGDKDDWVTDGQSYQFNSESCNFYAETLTPNDVHLSFCTDFGDWFLSFQAPSGSDFAVGHYKEAVSYDLGNNGKPALAVSGPGNGCSEISGEFTVNKIDIREGVLQSMDIIFLQHCDGSSAKLRGHLQFSQ